MTLRRVAQDGLKVRASAGAASFRRRQSLDRCYEEAKEQVRKLKRELEDDGPASTRREQAARERAAAERQALIEAAREEAPLIEEQREAQAKKDQKRLKAKEIRVSTTDAESRVMKMADGGYRPAWNVQLAAGVDGGCIVGVEVTNNGTDQPNLVRGAPGSASEMRQPAGPEARQPGSDRRRPPPRPDGRVRRE